MGRVTTVTLRWLLVLALLVGICIPFVQAVQYVTFNTTITPSSSEVNEGETATFNITIVHDSRDIESFSVYSPDIIWDIHTKETLYVPAGPDGLTTELYITPLRVPSGLYGVPVSIRLHKSNQEIDKSIQLEVFSSQLGKGGYLPALRGTVRIADKVDPRDPVRITVTLTNQNRLNLSRVDIKARSALINVDKSVHLAPLQTKTVSLEADMDPLTPPMEDTLRISLFAFDKDGKAFQFDVPSVKYMITRYGEMKAEADQRNTFLSYAQVITLSNTGNVPVSDEYRVPASWWQHLFTRTEPAVAYVNGEYRWEVDLGVDKTEILVISTNYWSLFVAVLLAILFITAYFVFRSPVHLRKHAVVVRRREGGISELKVIVTLINRGRAKVRRVRVIDLIPELAHLSREEEAGTLAPEKVMRHEKRGTVVKWVVPELDRGEERIIVYRVKSKLSILGGLTLPSAVAKFEVAEGVERSTKSGSASLRL